MFKASNGTQSPDNNISTNWKAMYNYITIFNWIIGREREVRISFCNDLSAEDIFEVLSGNQFSRKQSRCWNMLIALLVAMLVAATSSSTNKIINSLNINTLLFIWDSYCNMQLVEYRAKWLHPNVYEEHFHLLSGKLYNHSIHTVNILQMLATVFSFLNFCIATLSL